MQFLKPLCTYHKHVSLSTWWICVFDINLRYHVSRFIAKDSLLHITVHLILHSLSSSFSALSSSITSSLYHIMCKTKWYDTIITSVNLQKFLVSFLLGLARSAPERPSSISVSSGRQELNVTADRFRHLTVPTSLHRVPSLSLFITVISPHFTRLSVKRALCKLVYTLPSILSVTSVRVSHASRPIT